MPTSNFPFVNTEHQEYFKYALRDIGSPLWTVAILAYLLSATPETRREFWALMTHDGELKDDYWAEEWQTADSRRVIALAFNLTYGDTYPELAPATLYDTPLYPVLCAAIDFWHDHVQSE